MNSTIDFYNSNSEEYINSTKDTDMSDFYNKFLSYVKDRDRILDLGCGSGRDSKYFKSNGYEVTAVDGSVKMCDYVRNTLGIEVVNTTFDKIDFKSEFDGVWACASLLHIDYTEIDEVLEKIKLALKDNGILFMCFKYGTSKRVKDQRTFFDYDEDMIDNLIKSHQFQKREIWKSQSSDEMWINVIVNK